MVRAEKTRLVRYLLYLYCVSDRLGSGTIFIHEERLQISEPGRKQNESKFEVVFKSLARFTTQFRVKESFKLLFAS